MIQAFFASSFTMFSLHDLEIRGGLLAACLLCVLGSFISLKVSRKIDLYLSQQGQISGASGVFFGILLRMMIAVLGIIGILLVFGKAWAIPCAIAMMPLCFIEVMCCMFFELRRVKQR